MIVSFFKELLFNLICAILWINLSFSYYFSVDSFLVCVFSFDWFLEFLVYVLKGFFFLG